MKKHSKTIIVSVIGGPGSGKSIFSTELFAFLKRKGVTCEFANEFIKEKIYEQASKTIQNQIYLFGKQQHKLYRLLDEVDVVVTDAPLPLFHIYDKTNSQELKNLVLSEFNTYNNICLFLERNMDIPFETSGRYQKNVDEAIEVDNKIKKLLDDENISYYSINGIDGHFECVYDLIKNYGK